ncbi:FTRC [Symbiodinium sp. CCMP2592]|nr:FTRC [Symbiodinium sp. CCMP2592]
MGVPDMQLEFFPQGRETSQKGFCALFLWCPGHLKLKYRLEVGSHASIDEVANMCLSKGCNAFGEGEQSLYQGKYGSLNGHETGWEDMGRPQYSVSLVKQTFDLGPGRVRSVCVRLIGWLYQGSARAAECSEMTEPLAFLSPAPGQGTNPCLSRATSGLDIATVPTLMHGATGPVFTAIGAQKGHTAALAVAVAGCLTLGRQLSRGVRVQRRAEEAEPHLEPSEKSIETMMKFSNQYAKVTGTKYCEDKSVPAVVIVGLALHKELHSSFETLGAPLCPCRHYEDKEKEVKDGYWNCPCVPMRERHECHCMLFLKDDNPFASECSNIDLEEIMKLKDG